MSSFSEIEHRCAGQLFGPETTPYRFVLLFLGCLPRSIIPILGDEWLNPRIIVTVKDNFLGTSDDQTIDFHNILTVDLARTAAEIFESEIRAAFVERPVGNDSYSKVRREE